MYPVYPELGWIHSVSSVSQLSEAAYTRALSGSRSLMPIYMLGENQTKPSQLQPAPPRRGPWRQAPAQVPAQAQGPSRLRRAARDPGSG